MYWHFFVSVLETVFDTPLSVSGSRLLVQLLVAVREDKTNIQFRVLSLDEQMLLTILNHEPSLGFNDDPIVQLEVRCVLVLGCWLDVLDLALFVSEGYTSFSKRPRYRLFQPTTETVLQGYGPFSHCLTSCHLIPLSFQIDGGMHRKRP